MDKIENQERKHAKERKEKGQGTETSYERRRKTISLEKTFKPTGTKRTGGGN